MKKRPYWADECELKGRVGACNRFSIGHAALKL
jgi:hypothetical protein